MTHPNISDSTSPLESYGITLTPEQTEAVLDRVEESAIERSEDQYHPIEHPPMTPRQFARYILYGEVPDNN